MRASWLTCGILLLLCSAVTCVDWSVLDEEITSESLFGVQYHTPKTKLSGILNTTTFWNSQQLTETSYRVLVLDRWWVQPTAVANATNAAKSGDASSATVAGKSGTATFLCSYFPDCVVVPMIRGSALLRKPEFLKELQTAGIIKSQPSAGTTPISSLSMRTSQALKASKAAAQKHLGSNSMAALKSPGRHLKAATSVAAQTHKLASKAPPLLANKMTRVAMARALTHIALLRMMKQNTLPGGPLKAGQSIVVLESDIYVGVRNAAAVLEKALSELPSTWDTFALYGGSRICLKDARQPPAKRVGSAPLDSTDRYSTAHTPVSQKISSAVALAYSPRAFDKVAASLPLSNTSFDLWLNSVMLDNAAGVGSPSLNAYALCNMRMLRPSIKLTRFALLERAGIDVNTREGPTTRPIRKLPKHSQKAETATPQSWKSWLQGMFKTKKKTASKSTKAIVGRSVAQ